jgi:hypothetical protein
MILIGVDVHKYSLTAVAVDEVGRTLASVVIHEMREHSSVGTPRSVFDFLHED